MATISLQPAFPLSGAVAALSGAAVVAGAGAWVGVPIVLGASARPVILPVATLAWVTAVLAVVPVALLGRLGVMATVYAYFLGAAARVALCLGGGAVMVRAFDWSALPAAVTLMIVYLPLLFIEAGLVGRYLWTKDSLAPIADGNPA